MKKTLKLIVSLALIAVFVFCFTACEKKLTFTKEVVLNGGYDTDWGPVGTATCTLYPDNTFEFYVGLSFGDYSSLYDEGTWSYEDGVFKLVGATYGEITTVRGEDDSQSFTMELQIPDPIGPREATLTVAYADWYPSDAK